MNELNRDSKLETRAEDTSPKELSLDDLEAIRGGFTRVAVPVLLTRPSIDPGRLVVAPVGLGASNGAFVKHHGATIRLSS